MNVFLLAFAHLHVQYNFRLLRNNPPFSERRSQNLWRRGTFLQTFSISIAPAMVFASITANQPSAYCTSNKCSTRDFSVLIKLRAKFLFGLPLSWKLTLATGFCSPRWWELSVGLPVVGADVGVFARRWAWWQRSWRKRLSDNSYCKEKMKVVS